MIRLDFETPLARFPLRIRADLGAPVTAVMGPSGAGKTSLLDAIAGLRVVASGRIAIGDDVLVDTAAGVRVPPQRRRVGYVPQDAGLFPHLSVRENVLFGAREATNEVAHAIEVLEIGPLGGRYPASLSGGEKQRVALARALATRPRLLLLDEPLAALDVSLRERIVPYLLRIRDEWATPMLYVTHNVGEARALAGEILLLDGGSVEAQGAPLALLATPGLSREARAGIENLFEGVIVSHDAEGGVTRVRLAGGLFVSVSIAAERAVGSAVTVAIRAEDVLVATEPVRGLSARNVYEAVVRGIERGPGDAAVRCAVRPDLPEWLARLTPAAVAELGLGEGSRVWLAVKSHSVRLASAPPRREARAAGIGTPAP
jgi:molybdate transport system ATP-binding protein